MATASSPAGSPSSSGPASSEFNRFLESVFAEPLQPEDPGKFFAEGFSKPFADQILANDSFVRCSPEIHKFISQPMLDEKLKCILGETTSLLDHAQCNRSAGRPHTAAMLRFTREVCLFLFEAFATPQPLEEPSSTTSTASPTAAAATATITTAVDDDLPTVNSSATSLSNLPLFLESCYKLIDMSMEYIVCVPLNNHTVRCQSETLLLLLSLISLDVYTIDDPNYFVEHILDGETLRAFVLTLLHHSVGWCAELLPPTPSFLLPAGPAPSILNLYNLFGKTTGTAVGGPTNATKVKDISVGEIVGLSSLNLTGLLCFHRRGETAYTNPALISFRSITNEEIPFSMLLVAVKSRLPKYPAVQTLLYLLALEHPSFLPFCLSDDDASDHMRELVVIMCRLIYDASTVSVQFLVLAIFHLFSHDAAFVSALQDWKVHGVSWYKERLLGGTSLGSLTLICALRVVATTAAGDRIAELASMAVGLIGNFAPYTKAVHPYAAQRIVAFAQILLKKVNQVAPADRDESAETTAELLVGLLEGISEMLIGTTDRHNDCLVYELLYNSPKLFVPMQGSWPAVTRLLDSLGIFTKFFESELASVSIGHTADDILVVIRKAMPEGLAMLPANQRGGERYLAYQYRETEDSALFFQIFLWTYVIEQMGLGWGSSDRRLRLLDADTLGAEAVTEE